MLAGRNRIDRLIRMHGLRGVQLEFTATALNQLRAADMTYIATRAGFDNSAVVLAWTSSAAR